MRPDSSLQIWVHQNPLRADFQTLTQDTPSLQSRVRSKNLPFDQISPGTLHADGLWATPEEILCRYSSLRWTSERRKPAWPLKNPAISNVNESQDLAGVPTDWKWTWHLIGKRDGRYGRLYEAFSGFYSKATQGPNKLPSPNLICVTPVMGVCQGLTHWNDNLPTHGPK